MKRLLKTFSWRFVATLITVIVVWAVTGQTALALELGGIEAVVKAVAYYAHEMVWDK